MTFLMQRLVEPECSPGNGYAYHFFTSDTPSPESKLVNNITRDVEYLIIGGGGSGGDGPDSDYQAAGGGGAGAFLTGTSPNLSALNTQYLLAVEVLLVLPKPGNAGGQGRDGGDTTWNSLTVPGGGGGGGEPITLLERMAVMVVLVVVMEDMGFNPPNNLSKVLNILDQVIFPFTT